MLTSFTECAECVVQSAFLSKHGKCKMKRSPFILFFHTELLAAAATVSLSVHCLCIFLSSKLNFFTIITKEKPRRNFLPCTFFSSFVFVENLWLLLFLLPIIFHIYILLKYNKKMLKIIFVSGRWLYLYLYVHSLFDVISARKNSMHNSIHYLGYVSNA